MMEGGQGDASVYLQSVDAILKLTESLNGLLLDEDNQVQNESRFALQMAMTRLEEVFCYILVQNKHLLGPQFLSFYSCEESEHQFVYWDSLSSCYYSCDDYLVSEDSLSPLPSAASLEDCQETRRSFSSQDLEEYDVNLISPGSVLNLKRITQVMFLSGYDHQCHQAYIGIRKNVLLEFLLELGIKKMSIEEVLKMNWSELNQKVKKWNRAIKIFVRVLFSEKLLCEHIFEDYGSASTICFIEISKGAILQLLSFAEAIAIGPRSSEKLFRVLDMYEGLVDLLPDIDALFTEEAGYCVRSECHEVLKRIGDSIRGISVAFENAVRTNTTSNPYAGGGVHPKTRYVMNYIGVLMDYSDTLNLLLEDGCEDDQMSPLLNSNQTIEEGEEWRSTRCVTPIARYLESITSTLVSNLDGTSKLYKDTSLQHIFLMNNIYYMVQKVECSALKTLLGGDWIRKHNGKILLHALSYGRATWSVILSFLKEDGIYSPGSSSLSRAALKDRFRSFNLAFEEIYKTQTAWLIADLQFREEPRISFSINVVQAYRTFLGRYAGQLESSRNSRRYIKYRAEDLENYVLDFFCGNPKILE